MVLIYTRPGCIACNLTKKKMIQEQVTFLEINIDDDVEGFNKIKSEGYSSLPVVVSKNLSWAGFRPDMIMKLK